MFILHPMAAGKDTMLQSRDFLQAYAFPLFALFPQLLVKLWSSPGAVLTLIAPFLAAEEMVSRSSQSPSETPFACSGRWVLLCQPHVQRLNQTLPVLRQSLRLLCKSGWKSWLLPSIIFGSQLPVEVVSVSLLVCGQRQLCFHFYGF